jgi:hypothetical protein
MFMRKILYVFPLSLFFVACGAETATPAGGNAGATDTGSIDTGSTDTGSTDTGSTDTGSTDTGSTDTGSTDTGSTDTGSTDTGSTDSGSTDTEAQDTGFADTGSTDTGSTDAGTPGTFLCTDGSEIPAALRCNFSVRSEFGSYEDCADGSDEANCPPFVCGDGSEIPYELRCNFEGEPGFPALDCADGSDEVNCEGLYFMCPRHGGVPYATVCNGENDCPIEPFTGDSEFNSDELSCFTCSDGSLISNRNICDGYSRDCPDGEDEASCP